MQPKTIGTLTLIAALSASPSAAQEVCENADSTVAMSECLSEAYRNADRELNEVWAEVLRSIRSRENFDDTFKADWIGELREAQRLWIQFRDQDCQEVVSREWFGGTGSGLAVLSCLIDATERRTENLRRRYLER